MGASWVETGGVFGWVGRVAYWHFGVGLLSGDRASLFCLEWKLFRCLFVGFGSAWDGRECNVDRLR